MSGAKPKEFSRWREFVWPIHGHELSKFLPMAFIMMFALFIYTVVRGLKDTLIVTASGAEVINFLKSGVVLPSSLLFVVIFSKLSNRLSRQGLYYACLLPFVGFFFLFGWVLFPYASQLHPAPETITYLQQAFPALKWAFPIYGLWTYSLFYVMAELWGNIGTSLLFWQFANQITPTSEAKRFYPMFAVVSNLGLIFAGSALQNALASSANFEQSLQTLIFLVGAAGLGIGGIYYWMNNYLMKQPGFYNDAAPSKGKKSKPKMSIMESVRYLGTSKYLGYITILVLGYGMSINLIEVTWKAAVKEAFPTKEAFGSFFGQLYSYLGLMTIGILYLTKGLLQRFSWFSAAIVTPAILLITGFSFFGFILWQDQLYGFTALLGITSPLLASVYAGMAQNVLGKGTKYALFDPTREMAYIPLDQEMKIKGKAAIDVIGGRMGKSGGGWIQVALLVSFGSSATQLTIAPYLAALLIVVVVAWMWAVKKLGVEYDALIARKAKEEAAAA